MKAATRLVVANWKMHPATLGEAKKVFLDVKKAASGLRRVDVVVCPPSLYLAELRKLYVGKRLAFGAQDVFHETTGPYTGELSAAMFAGLGASYAIIGHSERRAMGEDDALIGNKIRAALAERMTVILCIGERERDRGAAYLDVLRTQLYDGLAGATASDLRNVIIAYEPVWAIGGDAASAMEPDAVHETTLFIKKALAERYGRDVATSVRVLYGGSVEPSNAGLLIERGAIDGFLVGHASLDPTAFSEILSAVHYTPTHAAA